MILASKALAKYKQRQLCAEKYVNIHTNFFNWHIYVFTNIILDTSKSRSLGNPDATLQHDSYSTTASTDNDGATHRAFNIAALQLGSFIEMIQTKQHDKIRLLL